MPPRNKIIKYDLEARAIELKGQGKPLSEISEILSKESKQTITKSVVFRFFEANTTAAVQAVENSNKLKAKLAQAEINTIEKRNEVIDELLDLAREAKKHEDYKAAAAALKEVNPILVTLDQLSGKLLKDREGGGNNVNIFNVQEATNGAREQLTRRINSIAARFEEVGDPGQSE